MSTGFGPIVVGLRSTGVDAFERELLGKPEVGGVILFARNYADPEQLAGLVRQIRDVRHDLLVTVDQEGGRVQRFRDGFVALPPTAEFGVLYDQDPSTALQRARAGGWVMAAELRACGVDLSFAPVVDRGLGVSSVIGDRALHADPATVVELAQSFARGMYAAGMAAVAKHFPGHGAVAADSHATLPSDPRPLAEIASTDLMAFQRMAALGIPGMMTAHVVFPEVDDRPASFSPFWIQEVLRRRIGYQGAVISDDLNMEAAASFGGVGERALSALSAGCDAVLACDPETAPEAVEALRGFETSREEPRREQQSLRLARLTGRPAPDWQQLHAAPQWSEALATLFGR